MATWLVHLHIAEKLKDLVKEEDYGAFLVGSIAPDCGEGIKDSDQFVPSGLITHFRLAEGKSRLRSDEFYDLYCQKYNAFYLGYYIHLCTDMLYSWNIYKPVYKKLNKDNSMIPVIKKEWNDCDYLSHDFACLDELIKMSDFKNSYLDYYDEDVFVRHIPEIVNYYRNYDYRESELRYYTVKTRAAFIDFACEKIRENLKDKGVQYDS